MYISLLFRLHQVVNIGLQHVTQRLCWGYLKYCWGYYQELEGHRDSQDQYVARNMQNSMPLSLYFYQIGLPDALDIALTGKNIRADKAKKLGLVDLLVDPLGPGVKPQEEMNVEYIEHVAVKIARFVVMIILSFGACHLTFNRALAAKQIPMPSREHKWTNMKGLKCNLTNNQSYIRNYVLSQAKKMVMKQTNGLYPAPLKILEVSAESKP